MKFKIVIIFICLLIGQQAGYAQTIETEIANQRKHYEEKKKLKNDVDSLNLELERNKLQSEINKLRGESSFAGKDIKSSHGDGSSDLNVVFIVNSEKVKEAILKINDKHYSVQEGSSPIPGILIKTINLNSVTVLINEKTELNLTVNFLAS